MIILSIYLRKFILSILFISHFTINKISDYFISTFIAEYIFSSIFKDLDCFYQNQLRFINRFFVIWIDTLKRYCQHNFYELDDAEHKMWQVQN